MQATRERDLVLEAGLDAVALGVATNELENCASPSALVIGKEHLTHATHGDSTDDAKAMKDLVRHGDPKSKLGARVEPRRERDRNDDRAVVRGVCSDSGHVRCLPRTRGEKRARLLAALDRRRCCGMRDALLLTNTPRHSVAKNGEVMKAFIVVVAMTFSAIGARAEPMRDFTVTPWACSGPSWARRCLLEPLRHEWHPAPGPQPDPVPPEVAAPHTGAQARSTEQRPSAASLSR